MRLIGLNGFKTAGKDTVCDFIKQLEAEKDEPALVTRAAFADKIKVLAAMTIGYENMDPADYINIMDACKEFWTFHLDNGGGRHWKFTGREYLQWLGGNARKVFGDSFWVDQVLPEPGDSDRTNAFNLWQRYPETDVLIVTDVRYPNEAKRIKTLGGEIWEIVRPNVFSDGHISEQPLPARLVNRRITNYGTLEDLKMIIGGIV